MARDRSFPPWLHTLATIIISLLLIAVFVVVVWAVVAYLVWLLVQPVLWLLFILSHAAP